jgi:hypothetical protein
MQLTNSERGCGPPKLLKKRYVVQDPDGMRGADPLDLFSVRIASERTVTKRSRASPFGETVGLARTRLFVSRTHALENRHRSKIHKLEEHLDYMALQVVPGTTADETLAMDGIAVRWRIQHLPGNLHGTAER